MKQIELIKILEYQNKKTHKLLSKYSEKDFLSKSKDKKWSVAENIEHLTLTLIPLVQLFSNPKIMIKNWGKSNRTSKNYQELISLYQKKIGNPGNTTKPYIPNQKINTFKSIKKEYINAYEKLIQIASLLTEKELDEYQLPHPLMGFLTCREFLFFTHYHTNIHFNTIKSQT